MIALALLALVAPASDEEATPLKKQIVLEEEIDQDDEDLQEICFGDETVESEELADFVEE
ncbi:MAG: hypothetical protein ACD_16C00094G0004 [uncultured bacterium]|nr:MAG: hypothetical protein ACD_16C00094G0004 [uncultured bacterium]